MKYICVRKALIENVDITGSKAKRIERIHDLIENHIIHTCDENFNKDFDKYAEIP